MLGWLPMGIFPDEDMIDNPIPFRTQMRKDGMESIAHWVDDYRKSVCGKARYLTSSLLTTGVGTAIRDIDAEPEKNSWRSVSVPCPECYKLWKERPKEDEVD